MEKIFKSKDDIVSPDKIQIKEWNLHLDHMDYDSVTLSFDGEYIYYSNNLIKHPNVSNLIPRQTLDLRYWSNSNIITCWVSNNDVIEQLKLFYKAHLFGKYKSFNKWLNLRFDGIYNCKLVFCDKGYIIKCTFDELSKINSIDDNSDLRLLHLLSPLVKMEFFKPEKHYYYLEGEKSWLSKHGDIDPAYYHLLMYEE